LALGSKLDFQAPLLAVDPSASVSVYIPDQLV